MNLDFLTNEQKAQYGKFSGEPDELQLARYFHLDEADLAISFHRVWQMWASPFFIE
jgi:hypothetical protein